VDSLGAIRHRNIVKLLCCCSTFTTNLLVYEYMPNGSLGDLLHHGKDDVLFKWNVRCKIAIGAAQVIFVVSFLK
jgi:serine/threonine protein kinase